MVPALMQFTLQWERQTERPVNRYFEAVLRAMKISKKETRVKNDLEEESRQLLLNKRLGKAFQEAFELSHDKKESCMIKTGGGGRGGSIMFQAKGSRQV